LFQDWHIEIYQETERSLGRLQIGEKLRAMDGHQTFHGFDLYDHGILNDEIETKVAIQLESLVLNRHRLLTTKRETRLAQLVTETLLIC
jgi:hypothetical protein